MSFIKSQLIQLRLLLSLFFVVGLLGIIMRYAFVGNFPEWLDYRNVTHAHSHIAMLGWVYGGLYLLITKLYNLDHIKYSRLFWLTMLLTIGMLVSFPMEGYGFFSIVLNSLHILLSYVFIYFIYCDVFKNRESPPTLDLLFLKTALFFLFLSTLGTWALGILMNTSLKGTAVYFATIQFYLHFQFNGWFIFTLLALLFRFSLIKNIALDKVLIRKFYWGLLISCFFTYALAVTWSTPDSIIFWTNSVGVVIQLIALWYFISWLKNSWNHFRPHLAPIVWTLWSIALACLSTKIIMQGLVAIPFLAMVSYTIKNFVIGFIHLLNLGFVSSFILGSFYIFYNPEKTNYKMGITLFMIGFIGSECLLFIQGIFLWLQWGFIPAYYTVIFVVSLFLPLGIALVLYSFYKVRTVPIPIK